MASPFLILHMPHGDPLSRAPFVLGAMRGPAFWQSGVEVELYSGVLVKVI